MDPRWGIAMGAMTLWGCGAAPSWPPADRGPATEAQEAPVSGGGAPLPTEPSPPPAQTLETGAASDERWEVHSLGAPAAAPVQRPPRRALIDVRLHRSRLDNAFRLLANAGRFNLIVQGDWPSTVSLDLRRVEPYQALLTLAQAHGARVVYDGNIVVVAAD